MRFSITLLGTNAAQPTPQRFTSAQVLNVNEALYMIDCGEGAQMRLSEHQVRRSNINQIFISHLHGDHFYGLIGLLTSFALNERTQPLHIFSPEGLQEIIEALAKPQGEGRFTYPIHFHVVDTTQHRLIFEDHRVQVFSLPLRHRIPTAGYLFRERPRRRNIIAEKITQYDMSIDQIRAVKAGEDLWLSNGLRIPNAELTRPPAPPRAYAYCSDTMYNEALIPMLAKVDVLYHEATFLHLDLPSAQRTMHTTALQAAMLAARAEVGQLLIGHFSSRYRDEAELVAEARTVFPNTAGAYDGMTVTVPFRSR